MSSLIFYILSALILGTALMAVTSARIFRSAIYLLFTLIGVAALYFWMEVAFIAAVQIIVYVGGIVVLIIFSLFLTRQAGTSLPKPPLKRTVFSLAAAVFGIAFSANLIRTYPFVSSNKAFDVRVEDVGKGLLGTGECGYLLPFELVSILLLAAMIGCIVLAMKVPADANGPEGSRAATTPEPLTGITVKKIFETEPKEEETA